MENLIALLPTAFALMGSPGPVTLASAAFGAAFGWRAVPLVLAMTAGTATIIVMVALGVFGLLQAIPGAAPVLSALGGIYILYLAIRIWSAPALQDQAQRLAMPSPVGVYLVALANPKAYAAMAALFSGFPLIPDDLLLNGVVKSILLVCFATTVNLTWMSVGNVLARRLKDPAANRTLNRIFAVTLVLSVIVMLVL